MEIEEWLGKDNTLGIDIWKKKYCHNNESFDQWLERVSGGDAEVAQLIREKKFLFGGRILANRGLDKEGIKVTYSNCYVVPAPEDSIESIFDVASKAARTFSYGGGVGIDLSKLAPRGAKINNTADETSGAVSFTDLYSMVTGLIGQHGRRGALMLSMSCEHPDLEEFINAKTDLNRVTKANMSVRMTDAFMNAVCNNKMFVQKFERPETKWKIEKEIPARDMFMKLCDANYDYGEPGCLYWDRIKSWNLLSEYPDFEYAGVNPCAEEPLPAGGSCLLGSLNLAAFVIRDCNNGYIFDIISFIKAIKVAVRALNDVLDEGLALHPLDIQQKSVGDWRQIGLGIMGLADVLIKIGMKYGDDKSIDFCDRIGKVLIDTAIAESARIAEKKGSFNKFNLKHLEASKFYEDNTTEETKMLVKMCGMRNSQLLTIAPTGTLSTMLGISGGIEPIFATYYTRTTKSLAGGEKTYKIYTPIVWQYLQSKGLEGFDENNPLPEVFVTAQTLDYKARIKMQAVWQKHIDASISSTVNLPVNFPKKDIYNIYMDAWKAGCKGITVFRDGCKRDSILTTKQKESEKSEGITLKELKALSKDKRCADVWKDAESKFWVQKSPVDTDVIKNCIKEAYKDVKPTFVPIEPLTKNSGIDKAKKIIESMSEIERRNKMAKIEDEELIGKKRKLVTGCGNLHVVAFYNKEGKLREVFLNKGSTGGCHNFMNGLSRMISLCAKNDVPLEEIVNQLNSCGACPSYAVRSATHHDTSKGACCPMAVGNALIEIQKEVDEGIMEDIDKKMEESTKSNTIPEFAVHELKAMAERTHKSLCPNCGQELIFSGGCNSCPACGWSKCQ